VHLQQQGIQEIVVKPTEAGTFAFLNAMLTGPPRLDDLALETFLATRYNDDTARLVSDLVFSAFELLVSAIDRSERLEVIAVHKCFIVEKIPVLLESYTVFEARALETPLLEALGRVDQQGTGSTDKGPRDIGSSAASRLLPEIRKRFLQSCLLHNLVTKHFVSTLSGECTPGGLAAAQRYEMQDLLGKCAANSGTVQSIISELTSMNGNAQTIANTLIEVGCFV